MATKDKPPTIIKLRGQITVKDGTNLNTVADTFKAVRDQLSALGTVEIKATTPLGEYEV